MLTSVVVPFVLAMLGLVFWRLQLIAQRRFSVAEEAIVAFVLAKNALDWARSGATFAGEGTSRKRNAEEDEATSSLLDSYWASVERLKANEDRFASLERISLIARYHLGADAYEAFETLKRARAEVMTAVGMLIRTHGQPDQYRQQWVDVVWGSQLPDNRLTAQVNSAYEKIKAICDHEASLGAAGWPLLLPKRRKP